MKPLCIYHGNCADGFTAAWVVNRYFDGAVDFHPGIYGEMPPDVAGRDVIMVDFSYKRPALDAMAERAHSLLVLDHHKTAQEELADVPKAPPCGRWTAWDDPLLDAGVGPYRRATVFDMERSGAQITWDFFFPAIPRPMLVDYVGDRDLWRFNLPGSREVNAFIFSHDYTFDIWDRLHINFRSVGGRTRAIEAGAAIERKHHKDIQELVALLKRRMVIGGHSVWVANLPYTLTSDAGNLMAQGEPFAACYWDTPKGRVFSLRSTDDGLDVSAIAKRYGGGGHAHASGFQKPLGWEGDEVAG
jgi:oligoribonuclease NrnB/cAMP/cGMP phosphodiesterase (DHH superfamily)